MIVYRNEEIIEKLVTPTLTFPGQVGGNSGYFWMGTTSNIKTPISHFFTTPAPNLDKPEAKKMRIDHENT